MIIVGLFAVGFLFTVGPPCVMSVAIVCRGTTVKESAFIKKQMNRVDNHSAEVNVQKSKKSTICWPVVNFCKFFITSKNS